MAANNIVADGLNAIMNGQRAKKHEVTLPASKLLAKIVAIMKRKHYIADFKESMDGNKPYIKVAYKYDFHGEGVIQEIKRHSKSSRRVYARAQAVPRVKNGFATVIVSTSKGVMTGREARELNVGGEVICHIF